jgi:hypothetical protein
LGEGETPPLFIKKHMKSLKNGLVNYISFIRTYDMDGSNFFNVKLEKVVGTKEYNFYGVADIGSYGPCSDFITLPINLLETSIEGGEYYIVLSGANSDYGRYLCNVIDHEYVNSTSENKLFSDTVKISNL